MAARKHASPASRLKRYNAKRDFSKTSEPRGAAANSSAGRLRFVIQQHDARRMHYDFRLELDGVMKSWAIPKGPSLDPKDKRLAVETEDHPVSYNRFEGNIPQGEYGGGAVIVWDRGTWRPEGDPHEGLEKGHLSFELSGEKTRGRFSLARMGGRRSGGPKTNWLLLKRSDEHVRKGAQGQLAETSPGSVVTGRTVEEVGAGVARRRTPARKPAAKGQARRPRRNAAKATRNGNGRMPALSDFAPQLATLAEYPPAEPGYVYEIKLDGYRALASVADGSVGLQSRNNLDWSARFPRISAALARLKVQGAVLDGELCYVTPEGHTDFQALQEAMPRGRPARVEDAALTYFVFDLLWLDGEDLRGLPLEERKRRLRPLIARLRSPAVRYSEHLGSDGRTALAQACALKLEGLIAKRLDAPYAGGERSRTWLKLKCGKRQEFVIVGYLPASGARVGFRSLLLGFREGGKLRYAGKVGTGFSHRRLTDLAGQLRKLAADTATVTRPPRERGVVWVRPELVCEVSFTEMTRDGVLRHPSFLGLRQDKAAADVRRETAEPPPAAAKGGDGATVAGVRITHPERVMEQAEGTTKLEIARYYEAVADRLLPYALQRPLALVRCPEGDIPARQCFFQKHAMAGLGRSVLRGRAAGQQVLHIKDCRGLIELVQFNVVEMHGWGARLPKAEHADWMIFDLDPGEGLDFSSVAEAALELRQALGGARMPSFVKTTGGKGLHVVVPIRTQLPWDAVKAFTRRLAETMARQRPERYVANMAKARRKNRIFIDYLRNGQGATAVLPYSVRARPGATVAMPLDWKEVGKIDPREFTVKSAASWLKRRRKDPWAGLFEQAVDLADLVD